MANIDQSPTPTRQRIETLVSSLKGGELKIHLLEAALRNSSLEFEGGERLIPFRTEDEQGVRIDVADEHLFVLKAETRKGKPMIFLGRHISAEDTQEDPGLPVGIAFPNSAEMYRRKGWIFVNLRSAEEVGNLAEFIKALGIGNPSDYTALYRELLKRVLNPVGEVYNLAQQVVEEVTKNISPEESSISVYREVQNYPVYFRLLVLAEWLRQKLNQRELGHVDITSTPSGGICKVALGDEARGILIMRQARQSNTLGPEEVISDKLHFEIRDPRYVFSGGLNYVNDYPVWDLQLTKRAIVTDRSSFFKEVPTIETLKYTVMDSLFEELAHAAVI